MIMPASNNLSRTETGPVLLEGIQTFLGQTNVIEWGKQVYPAGENGGITGIVHYPTTRAEDDPRYGGGGELGAGHSAGAGQPVRDCNSDGKIDQPDPAGAGCLRPQLDRDTSRRLADVDNYPFGWSDGSGSMGTEDVKRNAAAVYSMGDAVDVACTDSWDDNVPTGCQGAVFRLQRRDHRLLRRPAQLQPGAPGRVRWRLCLRRRGGQTRTAGRYYIVEA